MSGFELLTITFSFIVGLGVAQVLRSVAYVVREYNQISLHWIPFSVAAIVLFFQVQFWFGLAVVNSLMVQWSWPVYILMLLLAIFIFLAGATVLPHSLSSLGERGLKEDFETRGRISLVFLALYLVGWIGVGSAMLYSLRKSFNPPWIALATRIAGHTKRFPGLWIQLHPLNLAIT